mgnify:CR=1 FL=1
MKKLWPISLALLVSASTYATQSRLIALGLDELDDEGSYYIEDERNMFLNPATVALSGEFAVLEYGGKGRVLNPAEDGSASVNQDGVNQTKAQGGVFRKSGEYTYGLYFGNESNTSSFLRIASSSFAGASEGAATGQANLLTTGDNQFDIFLAGGNEVKWGANLLYSKDKNESTSKKSKDHGYAVRYGMIAKNWSAHANISLASKSVSTETVTFSGSLAGLGTQTYEQEFKGKLGAHIGGSYNTGMGKLYGFVKTFKWEQKDAVDYTAIGSDVGGTHKGEFTTYSLGWGNQFKVNKVGTVFTNLQLKKVAVEIDFTKKTEINRTEVPITVGYEHAANTWLTLRGSVTQNVYGVQDNKNYSNVNAVAQSLVAATYGTEGKGTIANSTRVNAGASLNFGDIKIDGVTGYSTGGTLETDELFTRAAMVYKF